MTAVPPPEKIVAAPDKPHARRGNSRGLAAAARALGWMALAALVALGVLIPGLVWFAGSMPQEVSDDRRRTDAIVVLTGGSERLDTGLSLIEEDRAEVLFVSGVHRRTNLEDLLADKPSLPPEIRGRIQLGHVAGDTVGNAVETAVWMDEQGFTSLRLVTASYHMPRSLLEFRMAMPDVEIVPHPVFPSNVKQNDWWRYPGTAILFVREYAKYLVARLRLMLPDAPGGSPP